jgi:hypothetical protein
MGIIANIYDCEHGRDRLSILGAVKRVTVVNAEGPFEPTEDCPAVLLVPTNGSRGCIRAVPADAYKAGKWLMKGYSFIASSDGRFYAAVEELTGAPFYGAIALHDRCEG